MFYIVVLAWIFLEAASAQTTWKGLRFGTSEPDVRKEYQGTLQKKLTDDGQLALWDEDQKLLDQRATAGLHFDKSGKLAFIEVFLKNPFVSAPGTSAIGKSLAIITVLGENLAEKYGKPITEEGECRVTAGEVVSSAPETIFTCKKMWKSEGQTINLFWSIDNQRLSYYGLLYKPLPSDI